MPYTAPIRGGLTPAQYYTAANKGLGGKIYNVEDYGAVHDGVTDDTSKIQDAINACFAAEGGTVYFPNGVYIISGALQNNIGDDSILYNSQLYFPTGTIEPFQIINVKLLGESYSYRPNVKYLKDETGVILKSTIAGTGVFPSVICATGYGRPLTMCYDMPSIENIKILVNAFEGTTGPSMNGINFAYAGNNYLNNVTVCVDAVSTDTIEPIKHVCGIVSGTANDDFPRIGFVLASGFYYGVALGEGVNAETIHCYANYIGLMSLKNSYGSHVKCAVLHWNKYAIASQQELFPGVAAGRSNLIIDYLATEKGYNGDERSPAWCYYGDAIFDPDEYLFGHCDYTSSQTLGAYITKSNGGTNFLIRNAFTNSNYYWATATRPTAPGYGLTGWNTTTSKLECWNGATWSDLF